MPKIDIDDRNYQTKLLALMIHSPTFLRDYRDTVEADLFESVEMQKICQSVLEYFDKYKRSPDFKETEFWIKQYVAKDNGEYEDFKLLLEIIRKNVKDDLDFVYDHYTQFVEHSTYKRAMPICVKAIQERKYDLIPQIIINANQKSTNGFKVLHYFDNIYERVTEENTRQTIKTHIHALDHILEGGTARQELTVILAPTHRGKTTFLINLACAALSDGLYVVHFFAEQNEKIIAHRYDNWFSARSGDKLKKKPKSSALKIQKIEKRGGRLDIVDFRGFSIGTIRRYVYKQKRTPDVILIDYADKIVSKVHYNDRRHELAFIYDELIGMGREFNCAVWTASQGNRSSMKKKKVTLDDVAESIEKCNQADNVFTICQTDREKKKGDFRLFLAKVRNAESGAEIKCKFIYHIAKIVENPKFAHS